MALETNGTIEKLAGQFVSDVVKHYPQVRGNEDIISELQLVYTGLALFVTFFFESNGVSQRIADALNVDRNDFDATLTRLVKARVMEVALHAEETETPSYR